MRLDYEIIKPFLKRGAVLRDSKFVFSDGTIDPKWILLLSDEIEEGHFFCLTNSQNGTYSNSFVPHYVCNNSKIFDKVPCIVETQRIDIMPALSIESKYKKGEIEYKGTLTEIEVSEIVELIYEDSTVGNLFKEYICYDFFN
jgi:hypothetical protein